MAIQALREKRKKLALDARALVEDNPGESWTKDHQAQYDKMLADIDTLDDEIERLEKTASMMEARVQAVDNLADSSSLTPLQASDRIEQERQVFSAYLRGGVNALNSEQQEFVARRAAEMMNTLSTGTPSEGGYLVPTDFAATLLEEMKAFGGVRNVAFVQRTATGNPIQWPTTDATAEEGEQVGENDLTTEEDTSFGNVGIGAYMYSSKSVRVPFQLLQDSAIDLEAYIRRLLAQRLARITNKKFTIGSGVGEPKGIVTASSQGVVGAVGQTASVTYANLVDLEHSVDPAYREQGNCRYKFHDDTLRALKKMEDADGRPIFLPGIEGRAHNTILGYEYTINQNMAVMAANAKSILFGDFNKYLIRDVMDVLLFRMTDSAYTSRAQVGFLAFSRHDGNLIDSSDSAIKHYQNSAT